MQTKLLPPLENIFVKSMQSIEKVHLTEFLQKSAQCTVWKNEKFTLTQKIFRQINYLVILLVKPLF